MTGFDSPRQRNGQKWYEKTQYQMLLFAGAIAVFCLVLGLILNYYLEPKNPTQRKDLLQALGLITAGVGGAVGIYFTWRSQRLTQQAQNNTQMHLVQALGEQNISRAGVITERFTNAIAQLGSTNVEIRLGGIYALERIAREDRNYHWPIMEVLTSYGRTHAPRKSEEAEEDNPPSKPDIQAVLTVINRRSTFNMDVEYGPINLNGTDLRQVDLQTAALRGADLREADLRRADLRGADLRRADLRRADFRGADLRRADLSEVRGLTQLQIEGAIVDMTVILPEGLEMPKLRTEGEGE